MISLIEENAKIENPSQGESKVWVKFLMDKKEKWNSRQLSTK